MKKISIIAMIVAMSFTSCSDFLDDNITPNRLLDSQNTPQFLLPGAQSNTFRTQAINMNNLGTVMTNAWGGNIYSVTGVNATEYSFNFGTSFNSNIWDNLYLNVNNFQAIIDTEIPNQGNYIAIAKIMKAHYMQYIVDFYGDCPYTEAFKGADNVSPAYDDDAFIYKELVKELEEARALIQSPSPDAVEVVSDVMLDNDMAKWLKFANTIELRILLRQSKLTDGATVAYLASKYADLAAGGNNFVTEDVLVNPGYSSATDAQQNPFYNAFKANSAGATAALNSSTTASKFMADVLNGDAAGPTAGVVDPRRLRMFTFVTGRVVGVDQGQTTLPGENGTTNPVSKIGNGVTGHVAVTGPPALTALQAGSSKSGAVMLLAESLFLQAEAVHRGHLTGNAQTLFNAGIQASFNYLVAVPATAAATYTAAIDSKPGFGWTATADKVEAIITQKWLALSQIHGGENYIEYTRTGYPVIPLPLNGVNIFPSRPKRLMYPVSEYNANAGNVPTLTSAQLITQGPFWYVP